MRRNVNWRTYNTTVTRGEDAPLPEKREAILEKILTRLSLAENAHEKEKLDRNLPPLHTNPAIRQDYSNGEFTSSSIIVSRTEKGAMRKDLELEVAERTVHFDAQLKLWWRQGGSFD